MAQRRWTLSICGAVGIVAMTAAFILLAVGIVVFVAITPKSQYQKEEDKQWLLLASCCRMLNMIQAAVGAAGYVAVSAGKARPAQLHTSMLVVLVIMPTQAVIMAGFILQQAEEYVSLWLVKIVAFLLYGARKATSFYVVKRKLAVFAASSSGCQKVSLWVDATIVLTITSVLAGVAIWSLGIWIRAGAGGRSLEAPAAVAFQRSEDFAILEVMLMRSFFFIANLGVLLNLVAGAMVLVLARHLAQTTVTRLAGRGVAAEMLSAVRRTLRLHLLGMVASISTGWCTVIGAIVNASNALGTETGEDALTAMLTNVDVGGDVAGLILLSGVWELLLQDDPDAGDFNRSMRSLLRSTVLTSRATRVFEGAVLQTPSNMCIASFPGKFIEDWSELTWLCEQRELSSACVFLPTSDPMKRFGQHALRPEDPAKQCWCSALYGEQKPWGCLWFEVWMGNIQNAVDLGLDLVVVYFPGQVGMGLVDWEFLPTTDLWDGVGLGGSQKAEVAFLRRSGFSITELDLEEARKLFQGRSGANLTGPPRGPQHHR